MVRVTVGMLLSEKPKGGGGGGEMKAAQGSEPVGVRAVRRNLVTVGWTERTWDVA